MADFYWDRPKIDLASEKTFLPWTLQEGVLDIDTEIWSLSNLPLNLGKLLCEKSRCSFATHFRKWVIHMTTITLHSAQPIICVTVTVSLPSNLVTSAENMPLSPGQRESAFALLGIPFSGVNNSFLVPSLIWIAHDVVSMRKPHVTD